MSWTNVEVDTQEEIREAIKRAGRRWDVYKESAWSQAKRSASDAERKILETPLVAVQPAVHRNT